MTGTTSRGQRGARSRWPSGVAPWMEAARRRSLVRLPGTGAIAVLVYVHPTGRFWKALPATTGGHGHTFHVADVGWPDLVETP